MILAATDGQATLVAVAMLVGGLYGRYWLIRAYNFNGPPWIPLRLCDLIAIFGGLCVIGTILGK
jgi:hypothetical protein